MIITEFFKKRRLTKFLNACENGDFETVSKLYSKVEINACDEDGRNGFYRAMGTGLLPIKHDKQYQNDFQRQKLIRRQKRVGAFLHAKGIDVNKQDRYGQTALRVCVDLRLSDVTRDLTNWGLNWDLPDASHSKRTPAHQAALHGDYYMIGQAVASHIDVNHRDGHLWTMASMASYHNHTKVLKVLIEQDADLSLRDEKGRTALDCAVERNSTEAQVLITEHLYPKSAQTSALEETTPSNSNPQSQQPIATNRPISPAHLANPGRQLAE